MSLKVLLYFCSYPSDKADFPSRVSLLSNIAFSRLSAHFNYKSSFKPHNWESPCKKA